MKSAIQEFLKLFGLQLTRIPVSSVSPKVGTIDQNIDFCSDDRFVVEFIRTTLDESHCFAPTYAMHRPVVRKILAGHLHESRTHNLVRKFCERNKGSTIHAGTFFGDMLPRFAKSVSGKVYAFEPAFEDYVLSKLCLESNKLKNVLLMNCALSHELSNLNIDTVQGDGRHAGGASRIGKQGSLVCIDRHRSIEYPRFGFDSLGCRRIRVERSSRSEGHDLAL